MKKKSEKNRNCHNCGRLRAELKAAQTTLKKSAQYINDIRAILQPADDRPKHRVDSTIEIARRVARRAGAEFETDTGRCAN